MIYKWYSDEWLALRDLENSMETDEAISYQIVSRIGLLPINEVPYLSGEKDHYKKTLGFFIGVTRVLKNDTTGKYKKLLKDRNVLQFDPDNPQPLVNNQSHYL